MVYTIIYKINERLSTFTFASKHDKNHAWADFVENYAKPGAEPLAMYPGSNIIYFKSDIDETSKS